MPKPQKSEYGRFYDTYIDLVNEEDVLPALEKGPAETIPFLRTVSEAVSKIVHPPYTWNLKQVLGHMIDTERVFAFRALCFARGDQNSLPGFDENAYALVAEYDSRNWQDLVEEFDLTRRSNILMFRGFKAGDLLRVGIASNNSVSVRALGYMMAGHERHHLGILRKRLQSA
ncbi:DinB family protein [Telmatocola sphagniphila]|uniref:DinB family protein n=1 Tax=Telmatocola sphagniphila TaxID=1123043 RepID=A0A8E6EVS2_9BACT|nr:DinB family protein [Telmatocola sphagniphila]QVL32977.1 DinB family protein [Telmatocola sphagniphila]